LLIGLVDLGAFLFVLVMSIGGLFTGILLPARDLIVREITPAGSFGRVFGFVYSGLDLGSCLTPLAFGWILDHGDPRMLFVVVGVLMLATIGTVVQVRRNAQPAPAGVGA